MFTISKAFSFSAAHHLTCVPVGHKCNRMHGHTYTVVVELRSEHLRNCMVRDYGEIGMLGSWLTDTWDHRTLNDVVDFEPTAERLAEHLYWMCAGWWPETVAVRVMESPTSMAEYRAAP